MTIHSWFDKHYGTITYSMNGSRNGTDGTADCSGSISQALIDAGYNIGGLLSTVTLGGAMKAQGFTCVTVNGEWDAQEDDIILMSWGADMASSGGAGGHVTIMHSGDDNASDDMESTDYWTSGQANTAITRHNIDDYLATEKPTYYEVWRKPSSEKPSNPPSNLTSNSSTTQTQTENWEDDFMKIITTKDTNRQYLVTAQGARWIKTPQDVKNINRIYAGVGKTLPTDIAYQTEIDSLNKGFN